MGLIFGSSLGLRVPLGAVTCQGEASRRLESAPALPTLIRVRSAIAPSAQGAAQRGLASCARFRFRQPSSPGDSRAVRRGPSRAQLVPDASPSALFAPPSASTVSFCTASSSLPWRVLERTVSGQNRSSCSFPPTLLSLKAQGCCRVGQAGTSHCPARPHEYSGFPCK